MKIPAIKIQSFYTPNLQAPNIKRSFAAPCATDTIELSFGRKVKDKDKRDKNSLEKRLKKSGCSKELVNSVLSDEKKYAKYQEAVEKNKNGELRRPLKDREILFAIENNLTDSETEQFIDLLDNYGDKYKRPLRAKECAALIKENFNKDELERYIELTTNTEEDPCPAVEPLTPQAGIFAVKNGLSDKHARVCNVFQKEHLGGFLDIIKDEKLTDRFLSLWAKDENSPFDEPLGAPKALQITWHRFDNEQAKLFATFNMEELDYHEVSEAYKIIRDKDKSQRYFELIQNKDEKLARPLEQTEALAAINLNDVQIKRYTEMLDCKPERYIESYLKVASNEEKANRFIELAKNQDGKFSRALSQSETLSAIDLDDTQIEQYIKMLNCGFEDYEAIYLTKEFGGFFDKTLGDLTINEKRILLKKIIRNINIFTEHKRRLKKLTPCLVPRNEKEYIQAVQTLSGELNISTKPINETQKAACNLGLSNIASDILSSDIDSMDIFLDKNGKINISNDPKLEEDLNNIAQGLIEIKNIIGKMQHSGHDYTLDKHTLKVLQEIVRAPEFENLKEEDKKILTITALLHDVAKEEGKKDKAHPENSAFTTQLAIQRLDLTEEEKTKIVKLIKTHSWFEKLSTQREGEYNTKSVALEFEDSNMFELAKILTKADLKGVFKNGELFDSFEQKFTHTCMETEELIEKLRQTKIYAPQTKIPKASEIKNGEIIEEDGIQNTILHIEKLDNDLSKYGFEKGTTKDNLKVFVHGFDNEAQMNNMHVFSILDNEAIISASHITPKDYRCFRQYGLILNVKQNNIHAGFYKDFGSGFKKSKDTLMRYIVFMDRYSKDLSNFRKYIPNLFKEKFNLSDEEYENFIDTIDEQGQDVKDKINEIYDNMQLGKRSFGREYNEFAVTNPEIVGVYCYDCGENVQIPKFLREYAAENDLPIVNFGN